MLRKLAATDLLSSKFSIRIILISLGEIYSEFYDPYTVLNIKQIKNSFKQLLNEYQTIKKEKLNLKVTKNM